MFTSYFDKKPGVWIEVPFSPDTLESVLKFIYDGQVLISHTDIDDFLTTCRLVIRFECYHKNLNFSIYSYLEINLFKSANSDSTNNDEDETYELNELHLLCRKCYQFFENESVLKRHHCKANKPKSRMKCHICKSKKTYLQPDLQQHKETQHGIPQGPNFTCSVETCDQTFTSKEDLWPHLQQQHFNPKHECQQCQERFVLEVDLRGHLQTYHAVVDQNVCNFCGKKFLQHSTLVQHKRSHQPKARKRTKLSSSSTNDTATSKKKKI